MNSNKNKNKSRYNRFRNKNQNKQGKNDRKNGSSGPFSDAFIDFYKKLLVPEQMSEEEFTKMLDLYRHPLHHVFRLSQLAQDHDRLENELNILFTDLQAKGASINDQNDSSSTSNSACIEYKYFPSKYGRVFKVAAEREQIRKLPEFEKFNAWLRFNTDIGNCHRQEFVSMIPPIFMNIEPNSAVLDTCAAPGSKTAQIMEMLSSEANPIPIPELTEGERKYGFIVANDSNADRCHKLVHQLQRVGTHNVIVTCQNAQKCEFGFDQFDRVLCDVPCTGDGTIRKNSEIGPDWKIFSSVNLHETQKEILIRGLELLRTDGICVYSTCSMNPIEDEAVVSEVISIIGADKVEIVDCSQTYPELKRHPGLKKWPEIIPSYVRAVREKQKSEHLKSHEETKDENNDEDNKEANNDDDNENMEIEHNEIIEKGIHTEAQCEGIEHCMRFYPQDHDSGGFFVCVLHKTADFERKTEPKPAKELKEAAYNSLMKVSSKHLDEIFKIYGIRKIGDTSEKDQNSLAVNPNQFFVRDDKKVNKVYYMSQPIADLINKYGSESLHTVSAGIQVFSFKTYAKNSPEIPYASQEGIKVVFQMATQRKYALTPDEMYLLLKSGKDGLRISEFEPERQKIFDNKPRSASIFYIENTSFIYTGHLSKFSLTLYFKNDLRPNEIRQLIAQFPDIEEGDENDNKDEK